MPEAPHPPNFIRTALSEAQERSQQEEADARNRDLADALPGVVMADCIGSGLAGQALVRTLHHHFPSTPRAQVYLAIGLAVAVLQADLALAEAEIRSLREALQRPQAA